MPDIRLELINAVYSRAYALIDYNIHNDNHKQFEFKKQIFLADKSLTKDEKTYAIRKLNKEYDRNKILDNEGTKRTCENCNQECLATLYCEYCVQNYLKAKFSNWTSGNNDIDNLIQKCQMESLHPEMIVEWIPYNNLQNIEYLTKGGFSEIYKAVWIDGYYIEWDSEKHQLERFGKQKVVLKRLENVESANQSWFEEAKSHLTINNKWSAHIVKSYGLTQDPSSGNYMIVIDIMNIDLRKYLQQNHNKLTWKERIQITNNITLALYFIHKENAIHRDLHSGNILYSQLNQHWYIGDLGFCGPADKSSKSIYGNLPYIAPEVISGKKTTKASDIYSIAMLMWEISSEQPPFINYEHDYDLAMNIINGIRPRIVSETPLEYENLMKQCWDADPLKRPDAETLHKIIQEIYQTKLDDESFQSVTNNNLELKQVSSLETNYTNSIGSRLFTSKVHQFKNFPEPRNATEEEQEAFHSNKYSFHIPDNIEDFDKSSHQKNSKTTSKISSIFKVNSKKLSKIFKRNSKNDTQNDYNKTAEMIQQLQIKNVVNINDEDETYNNSNFHSEEQDEFEIPDDVEKS